MALALGDFLKPHVAEVIPDPSNEKAAKITIEPLDRGFGHTLGNALRRFCCPRCLEVLSQRLK